MVEETTLLKKKVVQEIEKVELWKELLGKSVVDVAQLDMMCKGKIDKEKLAEVIKKISNED